MKVIFNMNITAIYALVRIHVQQSITYADRMAIAFFWPTLTLVIFGYLSKSMVTTVTQYAREILIMGALFEALTFRTAVLLVRNVYEEVKSKSVASLFSSPFTLFEWIISFVLYRVILFVSNLHVLKTIGL